MVRDLNFNFILKHCLFGSIKLAKNIDPGKEIYTRYCIGFDSCSEVSLLDGRVGKNVIIFVVDMS